MKKAYIILLLIIVPLCTAGLMSCDENDKTDEKDQNAQEKILEQAQAKYGMPNLQYFTMKGNMKLIQEMCDDPKLINYAYSYSDYTGKYTYIGRCIGYAIPYGTQYTNPVKVIYSSGKGYITKPQADPDGLFKPSDARGTWIMLIDEESNTPSPFYCENDVAVYTHILPDRLLSK